MYKFSYLYQKLIPHMDTAITRLFGVRYPIVSGGMVWCSGWRLAAAVSKAGGLGLIGAGSMHPETLVEHIEKCRAALGGLPFGVNVPIFYPEIERVVSILEEQRVPIVFTSGGSPALYTERLKAAGSVVVHVVASAKFAQKAEAAGVDAVVAEGFEAGGHNGRDETTTLVLVPLVRRAVRIPVLAAGGVATGEQVAAALALGADGVQVGSRFALCAESSAAEAFKDRCRALPEGDTMLALKKLGPVRLVRNAWFDRVAEAEARGASAEELKEVLGSKRSKLGIFEGDLSEGELEIGQGASLVDRAETAAEVINDLVKNCAAALERLR